MKLAKQLLPVECNTHYMKTSQGLQDCTPKEFDKETYRGLNRKHPNSHKTSMNPTNIGDPNNKK